MGSLADALQHSACAQLMYASRKPQCGGGWGTPRDSPTPPPAPGWPDPGTHSPLPKARGVNSRPTPGTTHGSHRHGPPHAGAPVESVRTLGPLRRAWPISHLPRLDSGMRKRPRLATCRITNALSASWRCYKPILHLTVLPTISRDTLCVSLHFTGSLL